MAGSGATRRGLGGELAERVAWSMVAALAAMVAAGLALAIGSAVVPALCPNDDGTCGVGWLLVIGALGYLLALLPACAIGGLGIWFWVAYVAGVAPLLVVASIGDWWWWAALVLLPPLMFWRTISRILKKKRHLTELAKSVPMLVAFCLSWGAGEAVGYWAGPGDALSRVR